MTPLQESVRNLRKDPGLSGDAGDRVPESRDLSNGEITQKNRLIGQEVHIVECQVLPAAADFVTVSPGSEIVFLGTSKRKAIDFVIGKATDLNLTASGYSPAPNVLCWIVKSGVAGDPDAGNLQEMIIGRDGLVYPSRFEAWAADSIIQDGCGNMHKPSIL
jgi:hypothetical protein